jgi:hypothetical protein
MDNQEFQPGDKVVLKNNNKIIYILLSINGPKALCLSPDNKEIELHVIGIEKYVPTPSIRIRAIG